MPTLPVRKPSFFENVQTKVNDLLISFHIKNKPLTEEEKELLNLTPEQIKIQKEAGELLDRSAYEQYFTLVKYGYQPSKSQQTKLSHLFLNSFELLTNSSYTNYDNLDFPYNKFLEYGYKPSYHELKEIIFNSTFQIYCEDAFQLRKQRVDFFNQQFSTLPENEINQILTKTRPAFREVVKIIKEFNKTTEFCDYIFEIFYQKAMSIDKPGNHFSVKYEIRPIYLIYHAKWLENNNPERVGKIKEISKKISEFAKSNTTRTDECMEVIGLMNTHVMSFDHDKFLNLVEQTKKAYTNSKAEIHIDILRNAIPKQEQDLPEQATKHIQFIDDKCMMLDKHKDLLTVEQSFTLKNIIEQRLPEILNEYKNIPEDIRDTVMIDNQKAKDLLISALENIVTVINDINLSLGEVYLQNLKVSENYTKKLSMGKMN
jgi:hypothetical protein